MSIVERRCLICELNRGSLQRNIWARRRTVVNVIGLVGAYAISWLLLLGKHLAAVSKPDVSILEPRLG